MRTLLLPITLLVTGCVADHELGTLTESEAATAYTTMKARLHEVHMLVLGSGRPPNQYEYGCSAGTIDLTISLDAKMHPQTLQHAIKSCETDSLTLDGTIYYRDLDPCEEPGTFAMSIYGRLDVVGAMNGFCYVQTRDACGALSGTVCGFPAEDLGP